MCVVEELSVKLKKGSEYRATAAAAVIDNAKQNKIGQSFA